MKNKPKKSDTNYEVNGYRYWRQEIQLSTGPERITAKNYGEWEKKRDQAIKDDALGLVKTDSTIGKAYKDWFDNVYCKGKVQEPTIIHREQIFKHNIKGDKLLKVRLDEVKTTHIQQFVNRKEEQGRSDNQIRQALEHLSKFFRYCVDEDYIRKNPCRSIILPGEDVAEAYEDRKIVVYSQEEIDLVLEYVKEMNNPHMRFWVFLALGTGARIGELLALNHEDIKNGELKINKTMYRKKSAEGKYITGIKNIPKTKKSKRTLALSDTIIKEYKIYRNWIQEDRLKRGLGGLKNDDVLFQLSNGKRLASGSVASNLRKIATACDFEYKSPHCFRHTFITKLAQDGVHVEDLMQITGHKKPEQLLRYYHIEMEYKRKIIQNIESIF